MARRLPEIPDDEKAEAPPLRPRHLILFLCHDDAAALAVESLDLDKEALAAARHQEVEAAPERGGVLGAEAAEQVNLAPPRLEIFLCRPARDEPRRGRHGLLAPRQALGLGGGQAYDCLT